MPTPTERSLVAVNMGHAGLGNRVRFTLSARAVAEAEGRAFSYVWPTEQFGARLTDLWTVQAKEVPGPATGPFLTAASDLTALRHLDVWRVSSASVLRGDGSEKDWEVAATQLVPTPALADEVAHHQSLLPKSYVGVQVRLNEKTHARTLEASPLSWYVHRMTEMRNRAPDTAFFLSCDDADVQAELVRRFPGCVAVPDKGTYNSRRGVESSVVDLHILAKSAHLLGPYWSSFVEQAWIMGGKAQPFETSVRTKPAASPPNL